MRLVKKIIRAFSLLLLFLIAAVLTLDFYISATTRAHIYYDPGSLPPSQTAIILGASVFSSGKLSLVLQERVDAAIALYQAGKVKRFLLSGDNRRNDYNEVDAMKNYLIGKEIPEEHIFTDRAGIDTYDSMYHSAEILGFDNAIVVTQEFHLPRAIFIAQNLGLNYKGYSAGRLKASEAGLIRREKIANFKAVLEVIFKPNPQN